MQRLWKLGKDQTYEISWLKPALAEKGITSDIVNKGIQRTLDSQGSQAGLTAFLDLDVSKIELENPNTKNLCAILLLNPFLAIRKDIKSEITNALPTLQPDLCARLMVSCKIRYTKALLVMFNRLRETLPNRISPIFAADLMYYLIYQEHCFTST